MNINENLKQDVATIVINLPQKPEHSAVLAAALLGGLESQKKYDELRLVLKIIKTAATRFQTDICQRFTSLLLKLWE